MKKTLTVAILLTLCFSFSAMAWTVVGTKHDLSTTGPSTTYRSSNVVEVCLFCHTPHGARLVAGQGGQPTNQLPLWNRTIPTTANYGIYNSVTMNANMSTANFGGASNVGSALCMSCHDGTIATTTIYFTPTYIGAVAGGAMITGNANLGSGATALNNTHPVNFTYDTALATADGGLVNPAANATVSKLLFGGTVQCDSCHDVHNNTNVPFLQISNAQSALCRTCHLK